MRSLAVFLAMCSCTGLYAQRANEIGIFTEQSAGAVPQCQYYFNGLQYTHPLAGHFALRMGAGVGKVAIDNSWFNGRLHNDTAFYDDNFYYARNVVMPMASAGILYRHHAWKKLSWYACMDVRTGYNPGRKDSLTTGVAESAFSTVFPNPLRYGYTISTSREQLHIFYIGIAPGAAIQVHLGRIAACIEFTTLFIDTSLFSSTNHNNICSWGGLNLRLFLDYSI